MTFEPDWTVHPGETLREVLYERRMSQAGLARLAGVSTKHINHIVNGRSSITAPVAVALEKALKGAPTARFWMNQQVIHDLHLAREKAKGCHD